MALTCRYQKQMRRERSHKLLKNSTLKVYEKYPHGMATTHADVIADLLAFIKG